MTFIPGNAVYESCDTTTCSIAFLNSRISHISLGFRFTVHFDVFIFSDLQLNGAELENLRTLFGNMFPHAQICLVIRN